MVISGYTVRQKEIARLLGLSEGSMHRRLRPGGRGLPPCIYELYALRRRLESLYAEAKDEARAKSEGDLSQFDDG